VNNEKVPFPLFPHEWLAVVHDPAEHAPHPLNDWASAVLELLLHPVYPETLQPPHAQSEQELHVTDVLATYLFDRSHVIQKFVESFTQNAMPGPLPFRVSMETVAFATSLRTQAGEAVVPSFWATFPLICQSTAFCHARTCPVSVDPSVPTDVFARVNVSETVMGISR
jgi:hypothetical protein